MLLKAENLWFDYIGIPILKDLNFSISKGERIALVGPNGSGKTTLLKILVGELKPSKGLIQKKRDLRIGYMEQFNVDTDLSLFDWIISFAKLNEPYEYRKARSLLKGFGFDEMDWKRKIYEFSGGEKRRIRIAGILLGKWDLILLDEPTNHLDILSVEMTLKCLNSIDSSIVIVTHDEYVLKRFPKRFMELNNGKIYEFKGNYENYLKQRERLKMELKRRYERMVKEAERLKRTAEKFLQTGDKKLAPLGKSKMKMYEKVKEKIEEMNLINDPVGGLVKKLNLRIERSGEFVLTVKNVTKRYGEKIVLNGINLEIRREEKVALLGKNGSGKTTLLKIIARILKEDKGTVNFGYNVVPSYMSQEHFEIPNGETPYSLMRSKRWDMKDHEIRDYLGRFGFKKEDVFKKTNELSGGEKLRLALSLNLIENPNFLIMDEPTNHLDIWTTKILKDFLMSYEGTILVVSHDREFVESICDRFLALKGGKIHEVKNIDEYIIMEDTKWGNLENDKNTEKGKKSIDYVEKKKMRNKLKKLKQKYELLEKEIEDLGKKRKNIEERANQEKDYIKLVGLTKELEKIKIREDQIVNELSKLEEEMMEIEVRMIDKGEWK